MPDRPSSLSGLSERLRNAATSSLSAKPESRKSQILKERYYDSTRLFSDPDPDRSQLCYECKALMDDIHCHPWSEPTRVQIPFGQTHNLVTAAGRIYWYRKFKHQTSCVLCRIIWDIVVANFSKNSVTWSEISQWKYLLKPTQFGEIYDSGPKTSFGQAVASTPARYARWCLGIEIDDLSRNKIRRQLPNVIRGATRPLPKPFYTGRQEAPFAQRGFLYGRTRTLDCDFDLLKAWPRLCARHHGDQCVPKSSLERPSIRLIDTENNCIVSNQSMNSLSNTYVALSYVWGDKEQVYAPTRETYSALFRKGALRKLRLSKTMSDAMLLVKQLGVRYLWADALCIMQEDSSEKDQHIAQMGLVYQSALFTIIAASGNDCDAGLPGVRPETRFKEQQLVQAGDITLLSSIQYPVDNILTAETSKWAQRAWTFQEELLSRRQMIFTDEQIWWRCSCATWCEESQLETEDHVGFLLTDQAVVPHLKDRYSKLKPKHYFDLVSKYAQRQLSYASDALNAFSGILSMLSDYSHEKFLWGLMNSTFERQLYWVGKAKMRNVPQKGYFPTWSWVAWEGDVSFRHYLTYHPMTVYYTIHEDANTYDCVRVSGSNSVEGHLPMDKKFTVSMEDITTSYPTPALQPNFHVFFYTYSAHFYLIPQGRLILPHLPPRYAYDKDGRLLGPKPDYGYLVPSLDGLELCEPGDRECILLGRRPPGSVWDVPHVVVMLIAREPTSGIAHRLGIADLSEEFWNLVDRKWELIALG